MSGMNNKSIDRFIAAADHFRNAEGWAQTCGFKYLTAHDKKEFDALTSIFVGPSDTPILLEIFVSDIDDADAIRKFREDNSNFGLTGKVESTAKNILRKMLKG